LREELPGKESRAKAAGILLRIWSGGPPGNVALRDRAVALLPRISGQERIWLHWGMTALAYPFFRDTAEVVGRLLALQDDFTTAQVQARMLTTWGDRATSNEAAQKLITSLVDWEVLRSRKTKGHFLLARKMTASIPDLQLWLLEALLRASTADEIEAHQLLRLPELFPFAVSISVADLRRYEGFNIHRQGLDMDMVALRTVKVVPPQKHTKKAKTPKDAKTGNLVQRSLFDSDEVVSGFEQPNAVPIVPFKIAKINENHNEITEQRKIEERIKAEVLQTLSERASRFLQVRGRFLETDGPFAAPSIECAKQFRDGHYFGCIALTQVVLEAVIRHIWQVKLRKKPNQEGSFEKNLSTLHEKKLISDEWKTKLEQLWANRQSFQHLRPSIDSDQQKLEEIARSSLKLLNELEHAFFSAAQ
jgi:hypothetical protein